MYLQVIFIFGSGSSLVIITWSGSSSLDIDHHLIEIIITGSGSSLDIITGYGSSLDLDHHYRIIIIGSRSSLDLDHHHGCYLMILLVTGSSIELALFHTGCRPSYHVGLIQHLYLTYSSEWTIQHLHITYSSERHTHHLHMTYSSERLAQHSHLIM